jgi:hypothetical protein
VGRRLAGSGPGAAETDGRDRRGARAGEEGREGGGGSQVHGLRLACMWADPKD